VLVSPASPHSFDYSAEQPVACVARRLAGIIILAAMENQCAAANGIFPIERDHGVEDLRSQIAIGTDPLIRHIAGMGTVRGQKAMFRARRVEMPASRFMTPLR